MEGLGNTIPHRRRTVQPFQETSLRELIKLSAEAETSAISALKDVCQYFARNYTMGELIVFTHLPECDDANANGNGGSFANAKPSLRCYSEFRRLIKGPYCETLTSLKCCKSDHAIRKRYDRYRDKVLGLNPRTSSDLERSTKRPDTSGQECTSVANKI